MYVSHNNCYGHIYNRTYTLSSLNGYTHWTFYIHIHAENDSNKMSFFEKAKSVMNKAASELKNEMKETYNKTKAKIETTIETTKENLITEVHERFTGGEPIPCANDGNLINIHEFMRIHRSLCYLQT